MTCSKEKLLGDVSVLALGVLTFVMRGEIILEGMQRSKGTSVR